jgi:hypothetical protein
MSDTKWAIHGLEFANCNCVYACPCQFNALPTYGNCSAVVGIDIKTGNHGSTSLDGLRLAGIFRYPKAIHEGNGEALPIVDRRANEAQRNALLRIMSGQDTKPGATMFQVFFSMLSKVHDPVFADIDFSVDVNKRRAQLKSWPYRSTRRTDTDRSLARAPHPHRARGRVRVQGGGDRARLDQGHRSGRL